MEEIWKDHPKFNGMVKISNQGRFMSFYRYKNGKIITTFDIDKKFGYMRVKINKHRYSSHRLIAEVFVPNPENKREVNHINGIKTDNRAENLEWVTHSENMKHAYNAGLQKPSEKQKQAIRKTNELKRKKVYQYDFNNNLIHEYISVKEASDILGISIAMVSRYCNTGKLFKKKSCFLRFN